MTILKQGSTGDVVKTAQRLLNAWGYYLPVDGIFSEQMYFAVVDLQRENGLTTDGIIGTKTWTALGFMDGLDPRIPTGVGVTASGDVPAGIDFVSISKASKSVTSPMAFDIFGSGVMYLLIAVGAIAYYFYKTN